MNKVTANAQLLLGYTAAALMDGKGDYTVVTADPEAGTITVENNQTGNIFELAIKQVAGTE